MTHEEENKGNCVTMFTTFTAQNPCKGNQIKKNVTGGACSTYGGEKNCMQKFGGENTKERDNSEYVGGYGMIIQMRIKQTGREDMLRIDLPQGTLLHQMQIISRPAEELLAAQERPSSK